MTVNRRQIDRRTVLGTTSSGLALALAGCIGSDDDGDENGETAGDDTESAEDQSDTDNEDSSHLDEAVEFPADEACAVCGMAPADHPRWNAQLVHEDETRAYFCSSGCLLAYSVDPGHFEGPDSEIATAWATGYETGTLVEAEEASFVRVDDADHVDDIMQINPTPFADRSDAEAFVGQFDAYDQSDIITYGDFDRDLAELYRAQFFDSTE